LVGAKCTIRVGKGQPGISYRTVGPTHQTYLGCQWGEKAGGGRQAKYYRTSVNELSKKKKTHGKKRKNTRNWELKRGETTEKRNRKLVAASEDSREMARQIEQENPIYVRGGVTAKIWKIGGTTGESQPRQRGIACQKEREKKKV